MKTYFQRYPRDFANEYDIAAVEKNELTTFLDYFGNEWKKITRREAEKALQRKEAYTACFIWKNSELIICQENTEIFKK